MINSLPKTISNKSVSFQSQQIFKLNIPKLNNDEYKLTAVNFTKLDPTDKLDLKLVEENKKMFPSKSVLKVATNFLSKDEDFLNRYEFYALEVPEMNTMKNKLLGLLSVKKINKESAYYLPNSIFLDNLVARRDLKRNNLLKYNKREYKNIGELIIYGISKVAQLQGKGIILISGNNGFYDALKMPGQINRYFQGEELNNFLKRTEKKFELFKLSKQL